VRTPGGSPAAPFPLELVRAFVNTDDPDAGDALASPDAAAAWLLETGLLPPAALDTESLARLRAARAAFARLLAGNGDGRAQAQTGLDAVAAGVRLRAVAREGGGLGLAPVGDGVEAAIGRLLVVAVTATANGTWERLKACRDPSCRWAFYDRSRNRSRAWCDMATCGNRAKVRAYRRRRSRSGRALPAAPKPGPGARR
jgi:predicted RNA-binding Zn ribbon-like protein